MRVWTYWTGPQPPWIGLCLETLQRNCPAAEVLTDRLWDDWYDGEIPVRVIRRQLPNVQSDILRSWLLARHGGIWVDADCVVFRDLRPIFRWLRSADFVAYRQAGRGGICSALIAATPGSRIGTRYWELMRARCAGGRRLRTLEAGPRLLVRAMRNYMHAVHWLRPALVHPVHWARKAELLLPGEQPLREQAWCFMFTHRALGPLGTATAAEILDSDTRVGSVFRAALLRRHEPAPSG